MSDAADSCPSPVHRVVPYLHVADVEQSVVFYSALGFREDGWYRKPSGEAIWASVKHEAGNGMVAEEAVRWVARNVEQAGTLMRTMLVGQAVSQSTAIYAMVVSLVLIFVI